MLRAEQAAALIRTISLLILMAGSAALLGLNRFIWLAGLSSVAGDASNTVSAATALVGRTHWGVFAALILVFSYSLVANNLTAFRVINDYKSAHPKIEAAEAELRALRDEVGAMSKAVAAVVAEGNAAIFTASEQARRAAQNAEDVEKRISELRALIGRTIGSSEQMLSDLTAKLSNISQSQGAAEQTLKQHSVLIQQLSNRA